MQTMRKELVVRAVALTRHFQMGDSRVEALSEVDLELARGYPGSLPAARCGRRDLSHARQSGPFGLDPRAGFAAGFGNLLNSRGRDFPGCVKSIGAECVWAPGSMTAFGPLPASSSRAP